MHFTLLCERPLLMVNEANFTTLFCPYAKLLNSSRMPQNAAKLTAQTFSFLYVIINSLLTGFIMYWRRITGSLKNIMGVFKHP
jgi:hypothetical protein